DEVAADGSATLIPYLKMRLAGMKFGKPLPVISGVDLNDQIAVRALSSWFLARVLQRSREWMVKYRSDRLQNRGPHWSAKVGVPVEHFDSPVLKLFEQVLAIAWLWVKENRLPESLGDLLRSYISAVPRVETEVPDFHAVPEIAAAVQSFVISREAEPGIYIY